MSRKNNRLTNLIGIVTFFFILASAVFFLLRKATYLTLLLRVSQFDSLDTYNLPVSYLENIKTGAAQKDILGRTEILVVKDYSQQTNENSKVVYLTLKLLTTYDKRNNLYTYQGVPILIGSFQNFKIDGVLLRGQVIRFEKEGVVHDQRKYVIDGFLNPTQISNQDPYTANTIANGVMNYLADKFKVGMKIKDSNNNTVFEIKDIKKEPAKRKFIYQNQLIESPDDERSRVLIKAEIVTEKYDDVFLYRQLTPIRINNNIDLDFWDFRGVMTITDFRQID